jgi:hypothetical protein
MTWYQIINTKSDSYVADRDAEDLLRHFSTALQAGGGPMDAEVFYGRTSHGAPVLFVAVARGDFVARAIATSPLMTSP